MRLALAEPVFRTSSYSTTGKECVEVADLRFGVVVRDTRNPGLCALAFRHSEWVALLGGVRGARAGAVSADAGRSAGSR
ncbi:DUF397 domain-containing protein [Nocardiopsis sp. NPDC006938]|uniref:DUF397 domain-containing protein n=1 Tax=Nocardiopsis sp. NPDC006938 TaxID=3364337 RepID=UPI003693CBD7